MKELSLPVLPGFHHINPGLNVMWLSSLFSPKATKLLIITLILKTNHENPINYHLQVQITCSTLHVQLRSVQSLSRVQLYATPWTAARQASLSITNSWSLLKLMSMESVMPSSHLILCRPLLLLPPIPPSVRVFSKESTLRIFLQMYKLRPDKLSDLYRVRARIWTLASELQIQGLAQSWLSKHSALSFYPPQAKQRSLLLSGRAISPRKSACLQI